MERKVLLILLIVVNTVRVYAQGNYLISGKINNVSDATLFLVRNDGMELDTVATTAVKNGVFMFNGKIESPFGAYLKTSDSKLNIPFIVEATNIMINVTTKGALIQGGTQQQLFTAYNRIGQDFALEQAKVYQEVQQPGADLEALQARIDKAYTASINKNLELIQTYPDAYATAYVIALGIWNETEESLQAKYDLLGKNAKNSVPGKQIAAALDRFAKLAIGEQAPNFTTTRPNGNTFTLYDIPAKIKLLVFWASDASACRQANPNLIKLYRQYRPKGFEIVSISLDNNRFDWERAIEQDGLIWSNGSDLQGKNSPVARLYMVGNTTLPYTILIDNENKIIAKGLLNKELEEKIRLLAKKNKVSNVKGELVIGPEVRSFKPEGSSDVYWIIDKTGKLYQKYDSITGGIKNGIPVQVKLEVEDMGKSTEGFATNYKSVYHVHKIYYIYK